MNHDTYSDDYLKTILEEVQTIALVGASPKSERPSNRVMQFLLSKGYQVWPVNPGLAGNKIQDQDVYASLEDLPEPPDMIDIFRNSEAAGQIVEDVLASGARPKTIWMQLEVRHDEAAQKAEQAGIKVVMDRCPKIEHARLLAT